MYLQVACFTFLAMYVVAQIHLLGYNKEAAFDRDCATLERDKARRLAQGMRGGRGPVRLNPLAQGRQAQEARPEQGGQVHVFDAHPVAVAAPAVEDLLVLAAGVPASPPLPPQINDRVECAYKGGLSYVGKVIALPSKFKIRVHFENGDSDEDINIGDEDWGSILSRPDPLLPPQIDDRVVCNYRGGKSYIGKVTALPSAFKIRVHFENGDPDADINIGNEDWGSILSRPPRHATRATRRARGAVPLAAVRASEHGVALRGRRIRKKVQGQWYEGRVHKFDAQSGRYTILFDDSDEDDMFHDDLVDYLVPADAAVADVAAQVAELGIDGDVASMSENEDGGARDQREPLPYIAGDNSGRQARAPRTVRQLHAVEVAKLAQQDEGMRVRMHRDYALSGVRVKYAVPPYLQRTDKYAIIDWLTDQNDEAEFADVDGMTQANCRLDFAEYVYRNQTSYTQYAKLTELMRKWTPVDTCFPETADGAPYGKDHEGAYLQRLKRSRVSLERGVDKKIEGRQQVTAVGVSITK